MRRTIVALSFALLAALFAAAGMAQDTFEFKTDFKAGETYRYKMTVESKVTAPAEQTTRTEIDYLYNIVEADEYSFTIQSGIEAIEVTGPQGTIFTYPSPDGESPIYIKALVGTLNALELTYDHEWHLVRAKGLGRLVKRLLSALPSEIRQPIGDAVETVLGPIATEALRDSNKEDITRQLFDAGKVSIGDSWSHDANVELVATIHQEVRVEGFGVHDNRPVCRTATTQRTEYQGLFALIGYGTQETKGTSTHFANGLPVEATIETTMTMPGGMKVETRIEAKLGTGTAGAAAPSAGIEELRSDLAEAIEAEDIDRATEILRKITALEPEDAEAWLQLAQVVEQKGMHVSQDGTTPEAAKLFIEAGTAFRRHVELLPEGTEPEAETAQYIYYNEACGYALTGEPERAMLSLEAAIDAGWADTDHISKDPDLTTLREREDFKALVASMPERASRAAKSRAGDLLEKNEPFEFSFDLPDLAGKRHQLSDLAGKVVIVDVWGTWCPPCRREIPHFVELYKKYHDSGLEIVGVNYEGVPEAEAKAKIEAFVKETGIPYTCVLGDETTKNRIPDFEGYPTTLFIDRTGKVRLKLVGYQEQALLEEIVTTLLEEKNN
ncbi:MAG: redoxin domain-containing protein [Planctomycetes bacterium]|nr:redoxin domain-containing protein [Planctomycetota bacterium]